MNHTLENFFRYALSFFGIHIILGTAIALFVEATSLKNEVFWWTLFPDVVFSSILLVFLYMTDSNKKRFWKSVFYGIIFFISRHILQDVLFGIW